MHKINLKKSTLIILIIFVAITLVFMTACTTVESSLTLHSNDAQNKSIAFNNTNNIYGINVYSAYNTKTFDRSPAQEIAGDLERYPEYNKILTKKEGQSEDAFLQEKQNILNENQAIFDYDAMDKDGNLFKEGTALGKKLFKHKSSDGLYFGNVADDAKAVTKYLRFLPYYVGNTVTGLYAPAGEVIKITIGKEYAGREFTAVIGATTRGEGGNSIGINRDFSRMPILHKSFKLQVGENYIGSPLGGPIYLCAKGNKEVATTPYEVSISGAVEQPLYVHNYTSDEEWERLRTSAGLYFDMEITQGVRFCMPASFVREKTAQEIKQTADFWYKSACLSYSIKSGGWTRWSPVTMLFDSFVPAGAAVAFVNADFCILPLSWATNSLDYNTIITQGAWGILHEFNHHHQGWGAGNNGEVTNNVINTLTYMLYTKIAENRTENGGLASWNWVSSAYHSLLQQLEWNEKETKPNDQLSMYATLAHSFGDKAMVDMANASKENTQTAWYKAIAQITNFDPTYYLVDFCGLDSIEQNAIDEVKAKNLPAFIPVASLYQSGLVVGDKIINMGKPFIIPEGKDKILDLGKYLAYPTTDFTANILKVSEPIYGNIMQTAEQAGSDIYTYCPKNDKKDFVDKFNMTVQLTNKKTGQTHNTVLIISLKQDSFAEIEQEIPNSYPLAVENSGIIMLDCKNVKIINAPTQYPGYIAENMLDGDLNTMLHTKPNLAFPLEFEFDFNEMVTFNSIQVTSRADGRARIKEYTLYIGNKTEEQAQESIQYIPWASGTFENKVTAITTFKTLNTRYLKLVANSYYQENYNESYIAIREINFGKALVNGNIFDNKNDNIKYNNWKQESSGTYTYLNNSISTTANGEAFLSFIGTDIAIYSVRSNDFGVMLVSIDGGEWQEVNLNNATTLYQQAVYIQVGLKNEKHTLAIKAKSGNINVDYFAINGTISKFIPTSYDTEPDIVPNGIKYWWFLIGLAIIIVIVTLVIVVLAILKHKKPDYLKSGFYSKSYIGKRNNKN